MTDEHCYHEHQLTDAPSIKITLFECFDNGGKTEVRTEVRTEVVTAERDDKDTVADIFFSNGKCAILIEQDGREKWWRYNPILSWVSEYKDGWYYTTIGESFITERIQEDAINHPKWTVESNGVKMRAYRMKDGTVQIFSGVEPIFDTAIDGGYSIILTALGFTPDNIMPYILHGKD